MLRSFIPFLLASLGFTMILWTDRMPLFEWQLSESKTNFSSACNGELPAYLITRFGESLDESDNLEDLKVLVRRSGKDAALDRLSLVFGSWLFGWSLIEVVATVIYIWQVLLQDKQIWTSRVLTAVFLTGIAIFICLNLSQVARLAGPAIGWFPYHSYFDCQGTLTFSAKLVKVYYEVPAIRFAGILMELAALGVMLRPVTKLESSKSGVG